MGEELINRTALILGASLTAAADPLGR